MIDRWGTKLLFGTMTIAFLWDVVPDIELDKIKEVGSIVLALAALFFGYQHMREQKNG